jgi:hypothetical protein
LYRQIGEETTNGVWMQSETQWMMMTAVVVVMVMMFVQVGIRR